MIVRCICSHEAQDKLHGSGNRVANECKENNGTVPHRCTVCEREHTKSSKAEK